MNGFILQDKFVEEEPRSPSSESNQPTSLIKKKLSKIWPKHRRLDPLAPKVSGARKHRAQSTASNDSSLNGGTASSAIVGSCDDVIDRWRRHRQSSTTGDESRKSLGSLASSVSRQSSAAPNNTHCEEPGNF